MNHHYRYFDPLLMIDSLAEFLNIPIGLISTCKLVTSVGLGSFLFPRYTVFLRIESKGYVYEILDQV